MNFINITLTTLITHNFVVYVRFVAFYEQIVNSGIGNPKKSTVEYFRIGKRVKSAKFYFTVAYDSYVRIVLSEN